MNTSSIFVSRIALAIALVAQVACMKAAEKQDMPADGAESTDAGGWHVLFDGTSLDGWKASDAPGTFSVADGDLIVHGPKSHLYYVGPVGDHDFSDFELEMEVMTRPGANSGVYFHTEYQPEDWPVKGFEVQVNNSHVDTKRTAGLYDIKDNYAAVAQDNKWFVLNVLVQGRHIVASVDGQVVTDYTQPDDFVPPENHPQRRISHGTFALQGHDPQSEVHYRNIRVRALPQASNLDGAARAQRTVTTPESFLRSTQDFRRGHRAIVNQYVFKSAKHASANQSARGAGR